MPDVQTITRPPAAARERETKHRFSRRPKRLARRAERDRFAFFIVPVIWVLAVLGVVGLLMAALHYVVAGEANWSMYAMIVLVPVLSAVLLMLFRVLRGHHHPALNEP